jgi:murein endopeptidase
VPHSTPRRARWRLALALVAVAAAGSALRAPASSEVAAEGRPPAGAVTLPSGLSADPAADLDEAAQAVAELAQRAAAYDAGALAAVHVDAFARRAGLAARPPADRVTLEVPPDRDLRGILRDWSLEPAELAALNPGLDVPNAPPGTPFVVWEREPGAQAVSVGRPNRGRLADGRVMPPGEGWIVREPHVAFGAEQTIEGLIDAMRVTMAADPKGQDLLIADISRASGGRLRPHRSHQSGRDVDATYFRVGQGPPLFRRTTPAELDAARTWTFVRALLTRHDIEYIFMAPSLQEALYAHAESVGEHPAFLAEVFERSPHGTRNGRAPIRNARGHADHMHIRFACTDADVRCSRAH